jgi:hypothetical protein
LLAITFDIGSVAILAVVVFAWVAIRLAKGTARDPIFCPPPIFETK